MYSVYLFHRFWSHDHFKAAVVPSRHQRVVLSVIVRATWRLGDRADRWLLWVFFFFKQCRVMFTLSLFCVCIKLTIEAIKAELVNVRQSEQLLKPHLSHLNVSHRERQTSCLTFWLKSTIKSSLSLGLFCFVFFGRGIHVLECVCVVFGPNTPSVGKLDCFVIFSTPHLFVQVVLKL